jgi:hypothetical protein
MLRTFLFIFIGFLFIHIALFSQEKFTISGYVKDKSNGEYLVGAGVFIPELSKGASTNTYGFYSLTIEKGSYQISISFLGYNPYSQKINLDKDLRINIDLDPQVITSQEVVITGERKDENTQSTKMGTIEMQIGQIKQMPALMGEVDILKTIQLLPGVQSAGEGNSGFYVRGGGPDQNLILLDEAIVYNASHLFGFFSVFNADAIKDVNLIKGGMPANYGGRLSSVLDISMKEGNNKKFQIDGGIGIISSRLTVQGPIKKDTSSFIISGRRTYIDVLMKPFINDTSPFSGSGYYFYDLNTKINYRLSDKDRLFLSGYFGRDAFSFSDKDSDLGFGIDWGNATASLRWNHLFNNKLFLNTSAIFSNYNFTLGINQNDFELKLFSGMQDWNGKVDFSYYPSVRHSLKFGANYVFHIFTPSNASAKSGDVEFDLGDFVNYYAHESAVYFTDDFELTEKIKINAGLRYSMFEQIGPFNRYIKNELNQTTDTIVYEKGEKVALYHGPEPRLSIRYSINSKSSIKAAFTQNYQYVHLASLASTSLPADLWVPSSDRVKPQFGTQYSAGYFRNFKDNMIETSVEVYYKTMKNLIEYEEGAIIGNNVTDNPDNAFVFGTGESYGTELFIKKSTGKLTGWIGYTLSWTTREFEDINNGEAFYAKYDSRHDISTTLTYELNERWSFSTVFVYNTGNALTIPVARYIIDGYIVNEYGKRNDFRMSSYHRLDLSVNFYGKKRKRFQSDWNFSIYNVYNRKNPYFIYFANVGSLEDNNLEISAKQVSLFPILPSVTWNFKF